MAGPAPFLHAPPPVVGHGSGALFHPRVVVIPEGDIPRSWVSAAATTSTGREVGISVRLARPPATSFVKLQTNGDNRKLTSPDACRVMAAHGDLLLIYMSLVAVADQEYQYDADATSSRRQHDWFVFRANAARPWLRRLPHAGDFTFGFNDPIGIVSLPGDGDGDDFIVADLVLLSNTGDIDPATGRLVQVTAYLLRYSSALDRWDDPKAMAVPYDALAHRTMPWQPHKLCFPCVDDDSIVMYWMDYDLGLMHCNIGDDSPVLRFVPPPEIEGWIKGYRHVRPEGYRTAGVCKGTVIFVHVNNGVHSVGLHNKKPGCFTITTWALKMPEFEWEERAVLRVRDELWPLSRFKGSALPRWVPHFPMLSAQHECVLHFILQEHPYGEDDWMITVDMHRKLLWSYEIRTKTDDW